MHLIFGENIGRQKSKKESHLLYMYLLLKSFFKVRFYLHKFPDKNFEHFYTAVVSQIMCVYEQNSVPKVGDTWEKAKYILQMIFDTNITF